MFDLFKKLLMARQLEFERGKIILMNEPVVIGPAWTYVYILKKSKNFESSAQSIYKGAKESVEKGFGAAIRKSYGLKKEKLRQWLKDIAELTGWGTIEFIKVDWKHGEAIIHAQNSTIAELYGKSKKPVDHVLRGYIAGGGVVSSEMKVDAVETKCKAMGSSYCEFIVKPTSVLKKSKDPNIIWQLR